MISKHTLTGATTYTDKRVFQACNALLVKCSDTNIPTDAKIEVTLNDGSGGQKLIPNLKMHDIAEITMQRFPDGRYRLNELVIPVCDLGNLDLGEDAHLVVSVSGLEAAKTYELIAFTSAQGKVSNTPLVYSNNTVAVGNNKTSIRPMPNALIAFPNSTKLVELSKTYASQGGAPAVTERMDLSMMQAETRSGMGDIAHDVISAEPVIYDSYINWHVRPMAGFNLIELDLDETGYNYILVENVAISL